MANPLARLRAFRMPSLSTLKVPSLPVLSAITGLRSVSRTQDTSTLPDGVELVSPFQIFPVSSPPPAPATNRHLQRLARFFLLVPPLPLLFGIPSGAIGATSSASLPADKMWWREEEETGNPRFGDHRWYIERTRDGFQVTQLQEWNGHDWRPKKLKGEPRPETLQQKLDDLNRTPVAAPTTASRPAARAASPRPPTYTPSPGVVSADVVMANHELLLELSSGDHTLHVDTGGRLGTEGTPLTLRIGPDPNTGIRRWIVAGQNLSSLPVNLRRPLERVDREGFQVAQIMAIIRNDSWGVTLTVNAEGQWYETDLGHGVGLAENQRAYEIVRRPGTTWKPAQYQVQRELIYRRSYGWQTLWSGAIAGDDVPLVLDKALQIANERLAREVASKTPSVVSPAPTSAPSAATTPPTNRTVQLTAEEIGAYATFVAQKFGDKSVFELMYVDATGRFFSQEPSSGVYYEVCLKRRDAATPDIEWVRVMAISGTNWLWDATAVVKDRDGKMTWFVHTPLNGTTSEIYLRPEFPLDTTTQILRRASEILANRAY